MIRNESEYREAVSQLVQEKTRLDQQEVKLQELGLGPEEIKRAMDPMHSFHLQLSEEVRGYEQLKRGEFGEILNLRGIGTLLIAARIARGWSQRQLAERLGVHESQVSRDERNEYHNVTLDRASRILAELEIEVHSTVELRKSA